MQRLDIGHLQYADDFGPFDPDQTTTRRFVLRIKRNRMITLPRLKAASHFMKRRNCLLMPSAYQGVRRTSRELSRAFAAKAGHVGHFSSSD
ncbi:MAG TPA: hypothetical protein VKS24_20405 [Bradyrhizobium sp.]|nr:hypothetical protein [Bradyrhizobium sp.]